MHSHPDDRAGHYVKFNLTKPYAVDHCQLEVLGFGSKEITTYTFKACNIFLPLVGRLPYGEARMKLCQLPGVGEKIADCVLLFGFNRLEAFPVDTWILKAMRRHYKVGNASPRQAARFGRTHFGESAGLAQQFLFAWERNHSGK